MTYHGSMQGGAGVSAGPSAEAEDVRQGAEKVCKEASIRQQPACQWPVIDPGLHTYTGEPH